MTFQIKHTKPRFFGGSFFKIISVFLLIFIFVFSLSFFDFGRSLVSDIFSPFFKTGGWFYNSTSGISGFFADKNKLTEENDALSSELESLRLDLADYDSMKYENSKLREDLKIKPAGNFTAVSIVARPPQIPLDSLLLNKGGKDGVNDGALVFAGERILIGKIVKSTSNSSTVSLNSFAGALSYGYVARTNEPIDIKGEGGGGISAKVPIDFDIAVGDKIMTAGSSQYLTAIVGSIEDDRSSGFKNVFMSLPVEVSKIDMVFVETTVGQ